MQIILVFLSVVAIWSTTPLAIVWSTLGSSFNFSVASRMLIGLIICLLLLRIKKQKLTLTRLAIRHYLHTGASIFITMSLVYYASQSISSGIISIIFGLTSVITGIFAFVLLKDQFLSVSKIIGLLIGLFGLVFIFSHLLLNTSSLLISGLLAVTLAMAFQAFISVKLKYIST